MTKQTAHATDLIARPALDSKGGVLAPLEVRMERYEDTINKLRQLFEDFENRFPSEWVYGLDGEVEHCPDCSWAGNDDLMPTGVN